MATVWLGLGSNIGDRLGYINSAIERLTGILHGVRRGGLYETTPVGNLNQADFLNTVVSGDTDLSPADLLLKTRSIEHQGGRDRDAVEEKGPRTIDIDILLYDGRVISEIDADGLALEIPHPSMHERLFVLKPLLDLDPDLKDPRDGRTFRSKASHLLAQRVKLYPT